MSVGGTSANERGDGRACDPAYVYAYKWTDA